MRFQEKFTTADLITADKNGIEEKKLIISNDTYALNEVLQELADEISRARLQKK